MPYPKEYHFYINMVFKEVSISHIITPSGTIRVPSTNTFKFYSRDLEDAISLAKCSMLEGPTTVIERAEFHIEDIRQYNPNNLFIQEILCLYNAAIAYQNVLAGLR
jgi:hypothetical protein